MSVFKYIETTKRLEVRPLREDDYAQWLRAYSQRLPSRHRHDEGPNDLSDCHEAWFVQVVHKHQELAAEDKAYVFDVFRHEDGAHLGMVDFSTLARDDFAWGRIGYTIHNQHWGAGYGREAVQSALTIAFRDLNYHRIEAHINVDNMASIHLAERVGMTFECIRKGFIYEFGEWTDNLIYYRNAE